MTLTASGIEPIPPDLMADPLDFFFAEHFRHRQLCHLIDQLSATVFFDADRIAEVVDFLRFEAPIHIIDEEEEYRPRAEPMVISREDVDSLFEAVTGIADGQTLKSKRAYSQLVQARGYSVSVDKCPYCKPEAKVLVDRGSYFGERMTLK